MKKALINGTNDQDGAYLLELLLSKRNEVHGKKRRSSLFTMNGYIDHQYRHPYEEYVILKLHDYLWCPTI